VKTRARFALGFAIAGCAIGAAFGAYAGYVTSSHYTSTPPSEVLNLMLVLCPPSIGSMALQNGGAAEGLIVWFIISLLNALLYGAIGLGVGALAARKFF
jgi:hypothetical protein